MREKLEKKEASVFVPFVLGGLVGAGIALLLAPKSGKEVRDDIKDLAEKLQLKPLNTVADRPVTGVYISDMVSDVIANAKPGNVLVTVQVHNNVIAAANLVDVSGIILTRGRKPADDMVALAEKAGIPVLVTDLNSWQVASMLFEAGLR
jgi:hypothetical protein